MFKKYNMLMEEAGNEGGGSGDFRQDITEGESFAQTLSNDLRDHKSLQNVKDVNDLANQFVNAQKMIGQKVSEPGEIGDEYYGFYNKLGRPEKEDGYEFDVSEDLGIDPSMIKEKYSKGFHKAGLTKKQAEILAEYQLNEVQAEVQKKNERNDEFLKMAHESFGGEDGWAKTSAEVHNFIVNNVEPEIRANFESLDNASTLTVIKSVKAAIDAISKEDQPLDSSGESSSSMSMADVQEKIGEILNDKDFRNVASRRHADLKAQYSNLVKKKISLKK